MDLQTRRSEECPKSPSEPFNLTCLRTHTYNINTHSCKVLKWIKDLQKHFAAEGREVNTKTIEEFAWQTLNSGKVGSNVSPASLSSISHPILHVLVLPTSLTWTCDLLSGDPWIWPCCATQDRSTVCRHHPYIARDHHLLLCDGLIDHLIHTFME